MSLATRSGERGVMVYAQAAASEPRQVLEQIDELLQALGTSKSNLLTARVLLSDADQFPPYDSAWNEWLDRVRRPLRVWKLADPRPHDPLVDITVTATK
ncbi:MAG TPA: Rid family hydrolase [Burkholderiales bacterium]|nr:Rid family hydrolase [Burkholderiales bacterium]